MTGGISESCDFCSLAHSENENQFNKWVHFSTICEMAKVTYQLYCTSQGLPIVSLHNDIMHVYYGKHIY